MVSLLGVVGLLVLVGLNTLVAAVLTRLFRVRLETRWGGVAYTLVLTPVVLLLLTLLLGSLAFMPNLGSSRAVLGVAVFLPLTLGIAFDYFWMPSPEDVDVPDTL